MPDTFDIWYLGAVLIMGFGAMVLLAAVCVALARLAGRLRRRRVARPRRIARHRLEPTGRHQACAGTGPGRPGRRP